MDFRLPELDPTWAGVVRLRLDIFPIGDDPTAQSNMLIQMGLDTVEIVLRTEETFNIDLPDDDCSRVITVGDLYRLVLSKLELPYLEANEVEAGTHGRDRSHMRTASQSSWSPADGEDVKEEAAFLRDLGSD